MLSTIVVHHNLTPIFIYPAAKYRGRWLKEALLRSSHKVQSLILTRFYMVFPIENYSLVLVRKDQIKIAHPREDVYSSFGFQYELLTLTELEVRASIRFWCGQYYPSHFLDFGLIKKYLLM